MTGTPRGVDTETSVLLLVQHEPPPDLDELRRLCRVEIGEGARLREQLTEHRVLYIWDYFWDRQTDELREAWPDHAAIEWAHIANVGVDKIDFPELRSSVRLLSNAAGVYERPIAEYVLAAHLFFAKRLRRIDSLQRARTWRRIETRPIAGGVATIVGAGPIGREIARLLEAVGMGVRLVGRTARTEPGGLRIAAAAELADLAAESDLLVLAAPLTDETRHMIGAEELRALGDRGVLVNVGRGELVDDTALTAALASRSIAGAALDVFSEEPLAARSPYWGYDNCLVSSHLSGAVEGWKSRLAGVFSENLRRFLGDEQLENLVPSRRGASS